MVLPWIILFAPLLSAAVILLITQRSRELSAYISVGAAAVAFAGSCLLFPMAEVPAGGAKNQFSWLSISPGKITEAATVDLVAPVSASGAPGLIAPGPGLTIPIGITVDALSKVMLLVVTGVGLLVHLYSLGYMRDDDGKARYFGGLSLFMFSMLGIVLADNFLMMFIFWELVGVSSYLLIGHWFQRPQAADAANKAFIVNRIGDFGFMIGILMIWGITGSLEFDKVRVALGQLTGAQALLGTAMPFLTVATLLLFMGPMGKSAQVPLHVWLPDAMEGPTPVSALIHAATMVAAGVYLLVRIGFIIAISVTAQTTIAWIGMVTAVLAALMATQQDDIKRILAYSTLSQLGYMISAIGLTAGDGGASMFHLFTHAFFKALLFLGAGSVIHALHHEQNIWKMGGLRMKMPVTFMTFLIGTLALTGMPGTSGFFSKDAILAAAQQRSPALFAIGLFTAFLTAFYMMRLFVVAFLNKPAADNEAVAHAHESPRVMTLPLIILAVPSLFAGYGVVARIFGLQPHGHTGAEHSAVDVMILATTMFVLGTAGGFLLYRNRVRDPLRIGLFKNKFYFDELYAVLVRWTQDALARLSAWFDRWVIDGVGVRGLSGATFGTGFILRFLQVGNLQVYAFFFAVGVLALLYFALLT